MKIARLAKVLEASKEIKRQTTVSKRNSRADNTKTKKKDSKTTLDFKKLKKTKTMSPFSSPSPKKRSIRSPVFKEKNPSKIMINKYAKKLSQQVDFQNKLNNENNSFLYTNNSNLLLLNNSNFTLFDKINPAKNLLLNQKSSNSNKQSSLDEMVEEEESISYIEMIKRDHILIFEENGRNEVNRDAHSENGCHNFKNPIKLELEKFCLDNVLELEDLLNEKEELIVLEDKKNSPENKTIKQAALLAGFVKDAIHNLRRSEELKLTNEEETGNKNIEKTDEKLDLSIFSKLRKISVPENLTNIGKKKNIFSFLKGKKKQIESSLSNGIKQAQDNIENINKNEKIQAADKFISLVVKQTLNLSNKESSSFHSEIGSKNHSKLHTNILQNENAQLLSRKETLNRDSLLKFQNEYSRKNSVKPLEMDGQNPEDEIEKKIHEHEENPNLEEILTELLTHKLVILVMLLLISLPVIDLDYINTFLWTPDQTPTVQNFCLNSLDNLFSQALIDPNYLYGINKILTACISVSLDGNSFDGPNMDDPYFYYFNFSQYDPYNQIAQLYINTSYAYLIPNVTYQHYRLQYIELNWRDSQNYVHDYFIPNDNSNSTIEYIYSTNAVLFLSCLLDILKAIFIALILILGSYIFSKDVHFLVILPLDKILTRLQFYLSNSDTFNEELDLVQIDLNTNLDPQAAYKRALLILDEQKGRNIELLDKTLETYEIDKSFKVLIKLISVSIGKSSIIIIFNMIFSLTGHIKF